MNACHPVENALFGGAIAACLLVGLGGLVWGLVRHVLLSGVRTQLWR